MSMMTLPELHLADHQLRLGGLVHRRAAACPGPAEQARLRLLQRQLARARKDSHRRRRVKTAIAKLKARDTDRHKDWAEKTSTSWPAGST